jgi:hypothetical protein
MEGFGDEVRSILDHMNRRILLSVASSCPGEKRFQGKAWLDAAAKQVFGMRPSKAVGRQIRGRASLARYILNLSSMWRDVVLSTQGIHLLRCSSKKTQMERHQNCVRMIVFPEQQRDSS